MTSIDTLYSGAKEGPAPWWEAECYLDDALHHPDAPPRQTRPEAERDAVLWLASLTPRELRRARAYVQCYAGPQTGDGSSVGPAPGP